MKPAVGAGRPECQTANETWSEDSDVKNGGGLSSDVRQVGRGRLFRERNEHLAREKIWIEGPERDERQHFEGNRLASEMAGDALVGGLEGDEVFLGRLNRE